MLLQRTYVVVKKDSYFKRVSDFVACASSFDVSSTSNKIIAIRPFFDDNHEPQKE